MKHSPNITHGAPTPVEAAAALAVAQQLLEERAARAVERALVHGPGPYQAASRELQTSGAPVEKSWRQQRE